MKNWKLKQIRRFNAYVPMILGPLIKPVIVVEYPKCGASWVSGMLETYFQVPSYADHSRLKIKRHDILQIHSLYRRRYRLPIIVVRDPRDVFVSYYHYQYHFQGRNMNARILKVFQPSENRSIRGNFCDYLRIKLNQRIDIGFHYRELVKDWLSNRKVCKLVRYEGVLANPAFSLIGILKYLGVEIDEQRVRQAVEENSFEATTGRKPGQEDEASFYRKGIAGDWVNYYNEDSCRLIWEKEGWTMRILGYESDDSWIEDSLKTLHPLSTARRDKEDELE